LLCPTDSAEQGLCSADGGSNFYASSWDHKKRKKGSDSNKDGGSLTIQFWAGSVSTAEITEVR